MTPIKYKAFKKTLLYHIDAAFTATDRQDVAKALAQAKQDITRLQDALEKVYEFNDLYETFVRNQVGNDVIAGDNPVENGQ